MYEKCSLICDEHDKSVYIIVGHIRFEWALIEYSNTYIQQKLIGNLLLSIDITNKYTYSMNIE